MSVKFHASLHSIVRLICLVLILGCAIIATTMIDYSAIADNISSIGYEPSGELESLIADINLTRDGERIMMGTRPELLDADAFNEHCTNEANNTYVLGCYVNNHTYVYNVQHEELDGIRQVTLAHEFLHAVWDRMSSGERSDLESEIKSIYDGDPKLQERLELYSASEFYNELHSIIGSEKDVSTMSQSLEDHYQKYFVDQSRIAKYFDGYNSKIEARTKRVDELKSQISDLRKQINELRSSYESKQYQLNIDIDNFNARARGNIKPNFTAQEFTSARNALIARQTELVDLYNQLTNMANITNQLITEYNSLAIVSNEIMESINSNYKATGSIQESLK